MINHAPPIVGSLDVTAPPYVAEVYYQSGAAWLSLYIHYPVVGSSHGGMYINEVHTSRGYRITTEDAKAFLDGYGVSLLHSS